MLLLYCQNAVVIGVHEDVDNVPASAYGSGTQIVPLPSDVTLTVRVGDPPPTHNPDGTPIAVPDSRLFARPVETKSILLAYSAQVRFDASNEGISFTAVSGVIPVKTDRVSQSLLNNLATWANSQPGTTPITFTQDNKSYAITAAEAISMFNAVNAHIQNARDIEGQCITDLNSATPTILTYANVDARFAGVLLLNIKREPPKLGFGTPVNVHPPEDRKPRVVSR
jgi:hypothetical protein